MADAYGKLTGRPGICLVTRGPGATHAAVGVHTAFQDSTPMILLIGQVASHQEEREAFQELDYRRVFGQMAKWTAQIDRADRIPEYVARAFTTACAGRPGPVVLALPEDMLASETDAADARPFTIVQPHPGREQLDRLRGLLERAERPLAIMGGGRWTARTSDDLRVFLERNELPAGAAFRRQDALDNDSRAMSATSASASTLRSRSAYAPPICSSSSARGSASRRPPATRCSSRRRRARRSSMSIPAPRSSGVSTGPSCRSSRASSSSRAAVRDAPRRAALARVGSGRACGVRGVAAARADAGRARPGRVHRAAPRSALRDAIVTNGAGNFTVWVHRFWRCHAFPQPARADERRDGLRRSGRDRREGVAPERTVLCFSGDGDFLMAARSSRRRCSTTCRSSSSS